MSRFNPGDRVVANKSIVATVLVYDEASGRLSLEQELGGGATNNIQGPISSYDLELLVTPAVTEVPPADEPVEEPNVLVEPETPAYPNDEVTTLDNLS